MESEFLSPELSMELHSVGFDEPCLASWNYKCREINYNASPSKFTSEDVIQLPLKQQVFKWFRIKHNLFSWVGTDDKKKFWYMILNKKNKVCCKVKEDNFDKSEELCIRKLIEIIK